MFSRSFSTLLRTAIISTFIAIPIFSLTIPSRSQLPIDTAPPLHLNRRQTGNSDASGDLYGLGLRIGAYLQIIGMLLSCVRSHKRSRVGIKLLSSAVCVSLLTAWAILVGRQKISPCEAWLVLSLTEAYGTPRAAAMDDSGKSTGGTAVLFCAISVIWQQIAFIWFFATAYRTLPLLGTHNRVWFFASVDISGWFRILMLVLGCIRLLKLPFDLVSYLNTLSAKFIAWTEGFAGESDEEDDPWAKLFGDRNIGKSETANTWERILESLARAFKKLVSNKNFESLVHFQDRVLLRSIGIKEDPPFQLNESEEQLAKFGVKWRRAQCFVGFCVLALTIAGVEKIIDYNALSPQNDVSRPGQMIPLVLGIITFIEGAANASMPKPHENSADSINQRNSSHLSLVDLARQHGFDPASLKNDRLMLDSLVRGQGPSAITEESLT